MRSLKALLLLSGLVLAADCQSGTYVVVSISAPRLTGMVTSVQLQVTLAGKTSSMTPTLREAGGGPINFPTDAVLNIPSGEGALTITATALGTGGTVATGTASGTVSHGHTLNLGLALMPTQQQTGALMSDVATKDFGGVVSGSTSSPATMTITNSGAVATGALATSVGGANASLFVIDTDGCNGMTLAAGASCMVTMHYAPSAAGSHAASLTVSATPGGMVTVSLSGMGIAQGTLSPDLSSKDFGTVMVGAMSASTTFTVSNSSTQASGPIAVSIGGTDPSQFAVTNNCSGMSVGTPCTISAKFTPTTFGTKHATITVSANPGGGFVINLTGVGQDSVVLTVSVSPTAGGVVTGGGINCGNGNATCSVMVTRTTTVPMVTLTEAPNTGANYQFNGWSGGGCSGKLTTCTVPMSAAQTVTASYVFQPAIWYTFDGDALNHGFASGMNLTVNGGTFIAGGKFGMALQLGSGGYAQVAAGARGSLGSYGQSTISIWVHDFVGGQGVLFDCNNRSTSPYGGIQVYPSSITAGKFSVCSSSSANSFLEGGCTEDFGLTSGAWHNVIFSYNRDITNHNIDIYVDGSATPVHTIPNNTANPIFGPGMTDALYVGGSMMTIDEVRIYNQTFAVDQQCTVVLGGTWNGSSCTLP